MERRRSERVDSTLEDVEVDQDVARRMGLRSGLFVPMLVADRAIGVIAAHNRRGADPRFSRGRPAAGRDVRRPRRRSPSTSPTASPRDSLRRVVEGQELERARARPRAARRDRAGADLDPARSQAGRGRRQRTTTPGRPLPRSGRRSSTTLQNVRRLAVELRPSALDDFGARRRRSSGSPRPFARAIGDRRRRRGRPRGRPASRPRSRRRSTGSSRRRSRTSPSTPTRPTSASSSRAATGS